MREEIILQLIKGLFDSENELHEEFSNGEGSYVLDLSREGDKIIIEITLKEDSEKEKFQEWVEKMDDDLFNEVWEALSEEEDLHSLNELYESDSYQEVISKFKDKTKEIAQRKIEELKNFID